MNMEAECLIRFKVPRSLQQLPHEEIVRKIYERLKQNDYRVLAIKLLTHENLLEEGH